MSDIGNLIEDVTIGSRVVGFALDSNPKTTNLTSRWLIELRIDHRNVELLRSLDWIEDYGAHVGGGVFLDMPEMGVEGLAEVLAIEPCPPLDEGEGSLVTGTFKHASGEVYELKLASESKAIGVTGTHPFWSVDREAWVSVIDLRTGETLKTLAGTTVVESQSKRREPETVYNIEVEGDHCYRVGESGVLVHNASAARKCSDLDPCDKGHQDQFLRDTLALIKPVLPYWVTGALAICDGDPMKCFVAFSWSYDDAANAGTNIGLMRFNQVRNQARGIAEARGFKHILEPVDEEYFIHAERQIIKKCNKVCSIVATNKFCTPDEKRHNQVNLTCSTALDQTPNCEGTRGPRRP